MTEDFSLLDEDDFMDLVRRYDDDQPGATVPSRVIDLSAWLDGTYVPPQPEIGMVREDQVFMLYAGHWHTTIALTASGKSWWGLLHAVAEMQRGNVVGYAHFEESSPAGTIERLVQLGVPKWMIKERFVWFDCSTRWQAHEFAVNVASLPVPPTLVILDGINAACGQQGWVVDKPESVGAYRAMFVTPATRQGAAVLSLGHPVKARDRQGERHSYGASGWLDEVDGVSFRLEASRRTPIRRGHVGHSHVFTVKDRPGQVEMTGIPVEGRESGWYRLGKLVIDDQGDVTRSLLYKPFTEETAFVSDDPITRLSSSIEEILKNSTGRFESLRGLLAMLREAGVPADNNNLDAALVRLCREGRLEWPEVSGNRKRPGWLTSALEPSDEGVVDEPLW